MPEVEKVETFNQDKPAEKKINIVPILIGIFAILIVVASIATVYTVLFSNTKPESEKTVSTITQQATPAATIKDDQDLEKAETDVDSIDPDSLSSDLDQNDKESAEF